MKLSDLVEEETKEQLDEVSRSGAFKFFGTLAGILGGGITYSTLLSIGALGALPIALVAGAAYGAYVGGLSTLFVKGKQRDLYDDIMSLVKKRDEILGKIKQSKEEPTEKQVKNLQMLSEKIKNKSIELEKLIDFGKGGAGGFRRPLSGKERKQLEDVISSAKGETKDLLSFKFNIDKKKTKL